jgi:Uma2 family endonuclease
MVAEVIRPYITPVEYLRREMESEYKSEYIDGIIVAMAGASPEHIDITINLVTALDPHIRSSGCHAYANEMRVREHHFNRYYYPDYIVYCGTPVFEVIKGMKSLANPSLIVEVLSPSTERCDKGEKWLVYKSIPTLTTYILIYQDQPRIDIYLRSPDTGEWYVTEISGIDAQLPLSLIGCDLPLARIYRGVEFIESDSEF